MIAGILLAAGLSRRFGGQKLLASFKNETLVERALRVCLVVSVSPLVFVVSRDLLSAIQERMSGISIDASSGLWGFDLTTPWGEARLVVNETPETGMADSLKKGLLALSEPERDKGVLISLADLPKMTPDVIRRLIGIYQREDKKIVVPVYQGRTGHPVIIHEPSFREEIQAIEGDKGLRDVIRRHKREAAMIPWPDDSVVADIDTPSDLIEVERRLD